MAQSVEIPPPCPLGSGAAVDRPGVAELRLPVPATRAERARPDERHHRRWPTASDLRRGVGTECSPRLPVGASDDVPGRSSPLPGWQLAERPPDRVAADGAKKDGGQLPPSYPAPVRLTLLRLESRRRVQQQPCQLPRLVHVGRRCRGVRFPPCMDTELSRSGRPCLFGTPRDRHAVITAGEQRVQSLVMADLIRYSRGGTCDRPAASRSRRTMCVRRSSGLR